MTSEDATKWETGTCALATGVRVPYVERGPADGVPVLFLHGATDSWRSFTPLFPHLPPSWRALAYTQRGHGDADKPSDGYRVDELAADAAAFLDAMEIDRCVVVGHSMGTAVALQLALAHPERTLSLGLIGAFASLHDNAGVRELWEGVVSTLEDPIDEGFVREFQQSTIGRPVPAAFFEQIVTESCKVPAFVWRALFAGLVERDLSTDLGRVAAPILLLWGEDDAFCSRAEQDRLRSLLPHAKLESFAGVGHAVHWEVPEDVGRSLRGLAR
ncbi:MAG: alpha/beta hydrolase [Myxococcales bacterium]|nr:alpha/beta hydrolase [Myxococcales bacterium]